MTKQVTICPCCGQKVVEYKHCMNKVLMAGLDALYVAGGYARLKDLVAEQHISVSVNNNFQKLRHFGLVESLPHHYYKLTQAGTDFVEGRGFTNSYVMTRNNVVFAAGPLISRYEVKGYVQNKQDWQTQATA